TTADGSPIATSTLGAHTFTVTATDNAGNPASVTDSYSVVDVTKPTVTITTPADGAVYGQNSVVDAVFSCADELGGSGLASCTGTTADGSPIATSTLGAHTFTVTATDNPGNPPPLTDSYICVHVT